MDCPLKPDASLHNPDPRYMRGLRESTGLTQKELAERFGMGRRMIQYYESAETEPGHRPAPYLYQFALERLASDE